MGEGGWTNVEVTLEGTAPTSRRVFVKMGQVMAIQGPVLEGWNPSEDYSVVFASNTGACAGSRWLQNVCLRKGASVRLCRGGPCLSSDQSLHHRRR